MPAPEGSGGFLEIIVPVCIAVLGGLLFLTATAALLGIGGLLGLAAGWQQRKAGSVPTTGTS